MPNYVESGYSENYVEGDVSAPSSSCDLTPLLSEISSLKTEISSLKSMLGALILNSQNFATKNDLDSLRVDFDFGTLATKDYIDSNVPFVDDMSVKIFKRGDKVHVAGMKDICTVLSSHYLPDGDYQYIVVYTVGYEKEGVSYVSNFPSPHVALFVDEDS